MRTRKNFAGMLNEDVQVREFLKKKLKHASVGRVLIERPAKNARVTIFSARPGVVIGKKGEEIDNLRVRCRRSWACLCMSVSKRFASRKSMRS
jgi:small subunit ribosomal protein S3